MSGQPREWTAVVLAGQRPAGDPLADHFSTKFKAHVPIAGEAMLARVVETVAGAPEVARVLVLAQDPAVMAVLPHDTKAEFVETGSGISASLLSVLGSAHAPWPVLVTTADHPLLTREMIAAFLAQADGCDLAVGMVERNVLEATYPQNRRTWLKFRDGHWSGANLFAFNNAAAQPALQFWARVEQDRKRVTKILWRVGPLLALRAFTRTIGLHEGLAKLGRKFGLAAKLVPLPFAEAAIDVDKPSDHELAERVLRGR